MTADRGGDPVENGGPLGLQRAEDRVVHEVPAALATRFHQPFVRLRDLPVQLGEVPVDLRPATDRRPGGSSRRSGSLPSSDLIAATAVPRCSAAGSLLGLRAPAGPPWTQADPDRRVAARPRLWPGPAQREGDRAPTGTPPWPTWSTAPGGPHRHWPAPTCRSARPARSTTTCRRCGTSCPTRRDPRRRRTP